MCACGGLPVSYLGYADLGGFFLWGDGADRALGLFFSREYYYRELSNFDETGVRNY